MVLLLSYTLVISPFLEISEYEYTESVGTFRHCECRDHSKCVCTHKATSDIKGVAMARAE